MIKQSPDLITHRLLSSDTFPELVKDILSQGTVCRFRANGHSMSPFIKDGDMVTLSPIPHSSPKIGDVIAFTHPKTEKLTIHRVVWKSRDSCLVKGENASEVDGFVGKTSIHGRVTKVERSGRKVLIGLGPERFLIAYLTRKGLFLSFVLPIWRVLPSIIRKSVRSFFS